MTTPNTSPEAVAPIIAVAGTYYRNARYIMFAIIVAMGFWFIYDGYVKYPAHNDRYDALAKQRDDYNRNPQGSSEAEILRITTQLKDMGEKHDKFSIGLQKLLGFCLPPIGTALLIYWMRKSRGEIRLENDVLTGPASPSIPLNAIDDLDKDLWDKKGIAIVHYTLDDNSTGTLKLDDFIYQARPIREIVKAIDAELKAQDELIAQARAEKAQEGSGVK